MIKQNIIRFSLAILIFAVAVFSWWQLENAFASVEDIPFKVIQNFINFAILAILWSLFYLLEKRRMILLAVPLLIIGSFFIIISPEPIGLIMGLASFLCFFHAISRCLEEKTTRLKFSAFQILHRTLPLTMTGLALLATIVFYWSPYIQNFGEQIIVPRSLFDNLLRPVVGLLGEDLKIGSQETEMMLPQSAQDELYNFVNEKLNLLGKGYKQFIPAGLAVSFFFTFKIIGWLLSLVAIFISWLIFKIIEFTGLVKIIKVAAERETVEI